jgi:hypothetical protein
MLHFSPSPKRQSKFNHQRAAGAPTGGEALFHDFNVQVKVKRATPLRSVLDRFDMGVKHNFVILMK